MGMIQQYTGRRDPRFVCINRGGLLGESTHRLPTCYVAALETRRGTVHECCRGAGQFSK